MPKKINKLDAAEAMVRGWENFDKWVLLPTPIPSLKDKRDEFVKAVEWARVELVHADWSEASKAARELSEAGGIENVSVVRVKHNIFPNTLFKDGRAVVKNGGR